MKTKAGHSGNKKVPFPADLGVIPSAKTLINSSTFKLMNSMIRAEAKAKFKSKFTSKFKSKAKSDESLASA